MLCLLTALCHYSCSLCLLYAAVNQEMYDHTLLMGNRMEQMEERYYDWLSRAESHKQGRLVDQFMVSRLMFEVEARDTERRKGTSTDRNSVVTVNGDLYLIVLAAAFVLLQLYVSSGQTTCRASRA